MKSPPLNQKFCATPKICKKLCCSSKIIDFTAVFQNFPVAQANGSKNSKVMIVHDKFQGFMSKNDLFGIDVRYEDS